MANYGPDDLVVEIDITDGGALTAITQQVQTVDGVDIENILEMTRSFGDQWDEFLQVGVRRIQPIVLEGLYDDTVSTGINAIATSAHIQTRTFAITYGSTKKTTVECWIQNYRRLPQRDGLTRYQLVLQPTGVPTEA